MNQDSTQNNSQSDDSRFDIPDSVRKKYPDLLELILITKSMDDKERQYWFHILPVMNDEQVKKLRDILENEKQKLAEIDEKYGSKNTNKKPPVKEMKEGIIQEKIDKVKEAEKVHLEEEAEKEAELLKQLEEL
jgi:hypothetical protein